MSHLADSHRLAMERGTAAERKRREKCDQGNQNVSRLRIYVSGPITKGDRSHNFHQACVAQRELMALGYAVMNPMLSILHPDAWTIDHETWLANDLPWVEVSHAILRLPGESVGADEECAYARTRGIPVFGEIQELNKWAWRARASA